MTRFAFVCALVLCGPSLGCRRENPEKRGAASLATPGGAGAQGGGSAGSASPSDTVGPIQANCFDVTKARPCPSDPSDPSGKGLPAHGGPCRLPLCSPCGSPDAPAYRDEKGVATAGYCMCVPHSDDSGSGSFSCFDTAAWKRRLP